MKAGIKYAVFTDHKCDAIGHFLDGKYYEPFDSDQQLGHLDSKNNFVYYMVTPEYPDMRIQGRVQGEKLIREEDGASFQIQQV